MAGKGVALVFTTNAGLTKSNLFGYVIIEHFSLLQILFSEMTIPPMPQPIFAVLVNDNHRLGL